MEVIIIPNIKDIIESAENTVDTFCAWTEALDVPVKDRPEERFLSVSKNVLKKIIASSADVDGLHRVLGSVALSLSSECYENATIKARKLPSMTSSQKQALSRKVLTFDEMARQKSVNGEESLHKEIREHQDLVAKFKTVQQISDELVQDIKDSIVRRLTHGVQCLEHAVSKFPRSETTEKCLKMIRTIDKIGVAYTMKANSTFYFCPQVLQHLQTYGWRECIPKARVDNIDVETTDAGVDLEAKLEVKSTMKIRRPGMLNLRQGMKIKQKFFVDDLDLAFGSRRICKLLPISWGYFSTSYTS